MLKDKTARALFLELAARGVCVRTGAVPCCVPPQLLGRVKANRAGLREVLVDRRDPDLEAVRQEGSGA